MQYTTLIGIAGASIILVAFLLNQAGKMNAQSKWYDAINAIGSLVLIVYAILLDSVPFVLLNTVWMIVSVKGLLQR
jgi:hypothetical protein